MLSVTVPLRCREHVCADEPGTFRKMVSQLRPFLSLGLIFL